MRKIALIALLALGACHQASHGSDNSSAANTRNAVVAASPVAPAKAAVIKLPKQPTIQELESIVSTDRSNCRDGNEKSCKKWDVDLEKLRKRGICWGQTTDQSEADYDFHPCGPTSLQMQPASAGNQNDHTDDQTL